MYRRTTPLSFMRFACLTAPGLVFGTTVIMILLTIDWLVSAASFVALLRLYFWSPSFMTALSYTVIGACGLRAYARYKRPYYYLADLPWRRPWCLPCVILLGPAAWICFIASWRDMRDSSLEASKQSLTEARTTYVNWRSGRIIDELSSSRDQVEGRLSILRLDLDWLSRRLRTKRRELKQDDLDPIKADDLRFELDSLTARLTHGQDQQTRLEEERQRLDRQLANARTSLDPTAANDEFDRLFDQPGVLDIRQIGERLQVYVRGSYCYGRFWFDTGDWLITFRRTDEHLQSRNMRSDHVHFWWPKGVHPHYLTSREKPSFCFGDRQGELDTMVRSMHYLSALALAANSINDINPDEVYLLPRALKLVRKWRE